MGIGGLYGSGGGDGEELALGANRLAMYYPERGNRDFNYT